MVEHSILIAMAQIAISLAGFAAVAASFGAEWSARKKDQLGTLLQQSGVLLFASLMPLVMFDAGLTSEKSRAEETAEFWMISSAIYFVCTFAMLVRVLYLVRKRNLALSGGGKFFAAAFVAVMVLQVANVVSFQMALPYYLALLINLLFGFITFVGLVLPPAETP